MVKVFVVFHIPFGVEKVFKSQNDAEKYCADRNTDMYIKSYGFIEYELE